MFASIHKFKRADLDTLRPTMKLQGNPRASDLFAVIHYLQKQEGIRLEVKVRKTTQGAV